MLKYPVHCNTCGSLATNMGGAGKNQYAYRCPACDKRWNQPRSSNSAVQVTISKRAVGNEPRRSGGYACGKCGAKPKYSHICPYSLNNVCAIEKAASTECERARVLLTKIEAAVPLAEMPYAVTNLEGYDAHGANGAADIPDDDEVVASLARIRAACARV